MLKATLDQGAGALDVRMDGVEGGGAVEVGAAGDRGGGESGQIEPRAVVGGVLAGGLVEQLPGRVLYALF